MESKTVVVTGGARGIGRAISIKFAENNFDVVILYNNSDELARELEKSYPNIKAYKCDISKYDDVKQISNNINNASILVNNAGISLMGLFSDHTEKDFDSVFDINVKGTFNVTNCLIKSMIANQNGVIINISSMWGEVGASLEVLYSASKGAIISFTKALAKEMGLSNIRVNCICPGVIKTDMIRSLDNETLDCLKEETPLNRLGTPEDIANSVYFLASDDASFITGQILGVNGGFII